MIRNIVTNDRLVIKMSKLSEASKVDDEVTTDANPNQLVKRTTVRLSQAADAVVRELMKEFHISYAEIVRLAVEKRLESFLGTVRYIDRRQGIKINRNIATLGNVMLDIGRELNAIGRNINQQTKAMNEEMNRRKSRRIFCADWNIDDEDKSEKCSAPNTDITPEMIERIIERYETATRELGDKIWHGLTSTA